MKDETQMFFPISDSREIWRHFKVFHIAMRARHANFLESPEQEKPNAYGAAALPLLIHCANRHLEIQPMQTPP
jgi:hypothetical protein